jgi:hypothetical protein
MKPDFDQGVANANQHHEADVTSAMNNEPSLRETEDRNDYLQGL